MTTSDRQYLDRAQLLARIEQVEGERDQCRTALAAARHETAVTYAEAERAERRAGLVDGLMVALRDTIHVLPRCDEATRAHAALRRADDVLALEASDEATRVAEEQYERDAEYPVSLRDVGVTP